MMQHILRNLKQSTRNRFLVTMYALQQFTGKKTGEYVKKWGDYEK